VTVQWVNSGSFDVGFGVRWGDSRKRSLLWAIHLGPRSIVGLMRFWL